MPTSSSTRPRPWRSPQSSKPSDAALAPGPWSACSSAIPPNTGSAPSRPPITPAQPPLGGFADEFWPDQPRTEHLQPEPGCSDATFRGSGRAHRHARDRGRSELAIGPAQASAHLVALPTVAHAGRRQERLEWPPDAVLEDGMGRYEVRIAQPVLKTIRAWINRNNRSGDRPSGTGGVLFGQRDLAAGMLWVDEACARRPTAPQAARSSPAAPPASLSSTPASEPLDAKALPEPDPASRWQNRVACHAGGRGFESRRSRSGLQTCAWLCHRGKAVRCTVHPPLPCQAWFSLLSASDVVARVAFRAGARAARPGRCGSYPRLKRTSSSRSLPPDTLTASTGPTPRA